METSMAIEVRYHAYRGWLRDPHDTAVMDYARSSQCGDHAECRGAMITGAREIAIVYLRWARQILVVQEPPLFEIDKVHAAAVGTLRPCPACVNPGRRCVEVGLERRIRVVGWVYHRIAHRLF